MIIQYWKSWLACWLAFFDCFDSRLDEYDPRPKDWNDRHWRNWGGVRVKYCPQRCKYLKPNENEQEKFKLETGNVLFHKCTKYDKILKHNGHHPELPKLEECEG